MRKILCRIRILPVLLLLLLAGCKKSEDAAELALITDVGTIEDGSFNQGAWEGIKRYAEENGINYRYYQPKEADTAVYLETIKEAVKNGAKLIICPGYLPEEAVYQAQDKYPKVNFILLDGTPHNADYTDNKVIRYGYGFVQGADYAAIEMGVNVDINYCYTDTFTESPEVQELAASWYQEGTEVIFACGGAMGRSVMAAAGAADAKVIGVDVDQSGESPTVITSAMKMLSNAVYAGVKDYYNNSFKGGEIMMMTAKNGGVGLPIETSDFRKFTSAEYDAVFTLLVEDAIVPYASAEVGTTEDLTLVNTIVTYAPL